MLGPTEQAEVLRYHRMLVWEGSVLFISLLGGGLVIAYYILRDVKQSKKIQSFFVTFSHELKTPLASLQLQAECLREDLGKSEHAQLIDRLVSDANRLSIQLENSLYLAEGENRQLFLEEVPLSDIINSVKNYWPNLSVEIDHDAIIKTDLRAFESILRNLLHNSVTHGKATAINVNTTTNNHNQITLKFKDNGSGYSGNISDLGKLFARSSESSGNGVGLYLSRTLMELMGGAMTFIRTKPNFEVALTVSGKLI